MAYCQKHVENKKKFHLMFVQDMSGVNKPHRKSNEMEKWKTFIDFIGKVFESNDLFEQNSKLLP